MKTTRIQRGIGGTTMLGITWNPTPQRRLSDDALVDLFKSAGLAVEIVDHCNDVTCPVCFAALPAKAA